MIARALSLAALTALLTGGAAQAEGSGCAVLKYPVGAGEFLTVQATESVPCRDEQPKLPVHYDRSAKAAVAMEPLPAGSYLGALTLAPGAIAAAGEKLLLTVRSGPVTIQRDVQAVQAVRSGTSGFMRTADGEVVAAPFVAVETVR